MAKTTASYEAMVIYSLKGGEDSAKDLTEKFKAMIESAAELESVDVWGDRKLAYEIDYQPNGYYVLYKFNSEPTFPAELDRVLRITDGVLRSLITVK